MILEFPISLFDSGALEAIGHSPKQISREAAPTLERRKTFELELWSPRY
jgi:hypothetical protein